MPSVIRTSPNARFFSRPAPYAAGLLLCALIASLALYLGDRPWCAQYGLSTLTLAIVIGLLLGNSVYGRVAASSGPGVIYAKQTLLRVGVVLYGLRLSFQDIGHVGMAGIAVDVLVMTSTFLLAWLLGTRVLRLDPATAILIGAGSSICGAAAVMATEPVVRAPEEKVAMAVATVVVFGTLSTFIYPCLFSLNVFARLLGHGQSDFGIYVGSTIHEVAQVMAAARAIGPQAAATAVIAKMVRVMLLAPFLVLLSLTMRRREPARAAAPERRVVIPWFAFVFVAVVALNSLQVLPRALVDAVLALDTWLLAMAMGALGLSTQLAALRRAGVRPLLLGGALFAWLVGGGAAINAMLLGA